MILKLPNQKCICYISPAFVAVKVQIQCCSQLLIQLLRRI